MKYLILSVTMLLLLTPALASAQVDVQTSNGYYGPAVGTLSAHDQQEFDKAYAKWVDATRKNDTDDITGNARKMQDIMARYNIPSTVPFDRIATNPAPAYGYPYGYPNGAYPNGYPAYTGGHLTPGDQQKFDTYYQKWVDAMRKNDSDDIQGNARHMQDIMAKYNIPSNTPFQVVATNPYGAAGAYPPPNPAYAYPSGQPQRLSDSDQKDFDKNYRDWLKARHKRDMDDVDKHARNMQGIMARYNIPANVPFDRIATAGAGYR